MHIKFKYDNFEELEKVISLIYKKNYHEKISTITKSYNNRFIGTG
jgi:hypothetical protein